MKKNLIAGAWVEGPDAVDNINPSDTNDVIASFARADAQQVNQQLGEMRLFGERHSEAAAGLHIGQYGGDAGG